MQNKIKNTLRPKIESVQRFEYEITEKFISGPKIDAIHLEQLLESEVRQAEYCYEDQQIKEAVERIKKYIDNEVYDGPVHNSADIENMWGNFNLFFWVLLIIRFVGLLLTYRANINPLQTDEITPLDLAIMTTQVVTWIGMPYLLWRYKNKLSNGRDKRLYWLIGVVWNFWFGPIVGYYYTWKLKQSLMEYTPTKQ